MKTQPPAALDSKKVLAFEAAIRMMGENDARLARLQELLVEKKEPA